MAQTYLAVYGAPSAPGGVSQAAGYLWALADEGIVEDPKMGSLSLNLLMDGSYGLFKRIYGEDRALFEMAQEWQRLSRTHPHVGRAIVRNVSEAQRVLGSMKERFKGQHALEIRLYEPGSSSQVPLKLVTP